jgi:hypothetical protein
MDEPSDYYLDIAKLSIRVKEIFGDPMTYVHWMMKIPEGKMLEYMKEIVRQVDEVAADTEWLSGGIAHYTEAEDRKAQADKICEAYEAEHMDGCGNDDMWNYARGQ